jgi:serine/threonine protein kinase
MANIARFEIKSELGRGGGGVVYRCLDPWSKTTVAVKVVAERPATDDREQESHRLLVERLRREADSIATLQHPNIVTFIEFGEDQGSVYFAMELVEGYTLEESLLHQDQFSRDEVVRILSGVAAALDFAHSRGIVHRDVKPANVMLTTGGDVKVMDFGTAKLLQQSNVQQLTMVGAMIGSAHYMSPEQVTESGVDGRSDQFSLAVIAYGLLAGRKPFEADSVPAILYQITSEDPPALTSIRTDLSKNVDAVFKRALAKSRDSRYATCAEFVRELRGALSKEAEPAGAPAAKPPAPQPTPTKPNASPVPATVRAAPPSPVTAGTEANRNRTVLIAVVCVVVVVLIVILAIVRR